MRNIDVMGPLSLGIEALENGRTDEALLHLGVARARLSHVAPTEGMLLVSDGTKEIVFPESVNHFEVIDHGRTENCCCFVTMTAQGGEISLQDDGKTAKLFLKSKSSKV